MIKGIPKDSHWLTDYSYIPLVWAAPKLVGFDENGKAANACYAMSASVLTYSLLTDAKWGIVKVFSYKTHALLDLSSGLISLAAPAVLKIKNKKARNTFLAMGLTGIVVGILSLIGDRNES